MTISYRLQPVSLVAVRGNHNVGGSIIGTYSYVSLIASIPLLTRAHTEYYLGTYDRVEAEEADVTSQWAGRRE